MGIRFWTALWLGGTGAFAGLVVILEDQAAHGRAGRLYLGSATWVGITIGLVSFLVLVYAVVGFAVSAALAEREADKGEPVGARDSS